MAGQKTISSTFHEQPAPPPPPPIPDFVVTGTLIPNANGNYFYESEHEGNHVYKLAGAEWYLWMEPEALVHYISIYPGTSGDYYWEKPTAGWTGTYPGSEPGTGDAIVSLP